MSINVWSLVRCKLKEFGFLTGASLKLFVCQVTVKFLFVSKMSIKILAVYQVSFTSLAVCQVPFISLVVHQLSDKSLVVCRCLIPVFFYSESR